LKRIVFAVAVIIVTILAVSAGYFIFQQRASNRISIDGVVLTVDLATTPAEQQQGLSGRDSMAPDHGMLFVFQSEDFWSFWMIKMKFSLDIIWFDSSRQAVFFEQNLPPCGPTVCQVFTPPVKAMYVLEVNAGFIAAHQISLGDKFYLLMFAFPMA
jgi:hypothetical protein